MKSALLGFGRALRQRVSVGVLTLIMALGALSTLPTVMSGSLPQGLTFMGHHLSELSQNEARNLLRVIAEEYLQDPVRVRVDDGRGTIRVISPSEMGARVDVENTFERLALSADSFGTADLLFEPLRRQLRHELPVVFFDRNQFSHFLAEFHLDGLSEKQQEKIQQELAELIQAN
ncbi:MAG: hypothetical protein Q8P95_04905 [bacterium]|nr:hypothetical protein [bacterium]